MLPVSCLLLPALVVKKLIGAGFLYAEDLFLPNNELHPDLEKILKLYPEIKKVFIENSKSLEMVSARDILKMEIKQPRIVCFSLLLDRILGGGVPLSHVLEICGPPGSGKTQLCLQMCISVQLHSILGGLQSEAVYIDTDAGFSPHRISEMKNSCMEHCCKVARANRCSNDVMLSLEGQSFTDFYYMSVTNYTQLMATVYVLDDFLQHHKKVKLVIVDSLVFPFLQVKNVLKRTILLCRIIQKLNKLALENNLAVVFTNHLTTRISRSSDQLFPALGECVGYLVHTRLMLGHSTTNKCNAGVLYKSSSLNNDSAVFKISDSGIRDLK